MVLKVTCDLGGVKVRVCPLITFENVVHLAGENSSPRSDAENKFFVLIDNVEVVDEPKGIVRRIGGVERLKSFDQATDIGISDSLYFSFKSLTPSFIKRFVVKKPGTRDLPGVIYRADGRSAKQHDRSRIGDGE